MEPGNHKGRSEAKKIRMLNALELKRTGVRYREIAQALNVSTSTAFKDVKEALEEVRKYREELGKGLVDLQVERLEGMLMALSTRMDNGDIAAINTGIKIMERLSKFLGMDAPTKQEIEQSTHIKIGLPDDVKDI